MKATENILEQFKKDISKHRMTILLDDGAYRHIRFAEPGTFCYQFDLVTWPGHLSITGDMGADTFARTPDMFTFFRGDDDRINPRYWSEKVVTCDSRRELQEFDGEEAKKEVLETLRERFEDDPQKLEAALIAAEDINYYDGETRCYDSFFSALEDYDFDSESFPDAMVWKFHYIWRCHAIVHGIAMYDEFKSESQPTPSPLTNQEQ